MKVLSCSGPLRGVRLWQLDRFCYLEDVSTVIPKASSVLKKNRRSLSSSTANQSSCPNLAPRTETSREGSGDGSWEQVWSPRQCVWSCGDLTTGCWLNGGSFFFLKKEQPLMALTTGENCRLVAGIRNGSRALEQAGTQGKSKQKPTRRNRGTTW